MKRKELVPRLRTRVGRAFSMKNRVGPVRHLKEQGCELFREGGNHSIFWNPSIKRTSSVPRHREVHDFLARKICRDLGVPEP